jgi:hypothetical protein
MRKSLILLLALLVLGSALPALAQDYSRNAQNQSQALVELQPGITRVSMAQGDVSHRRGDPRDWLAETGNSPKVEIGNSR